MRSPDTRVPVYHKGYVTTFGAIRGLRPDVLDDALGFEAGTLARGYQVYSLCEPVRPGEFEWRDTTAYSAGLNVDDGRGADGLLVPRLAQKRWDLYRKSGFNERAADAKLDRFLEEQCRRLNERSGPGRIVKVWPTKAGREYPNSKKRKDVRQWELMVVKLFHLEMDVAPTR